jgi:hypothetical protein
MTEHHYIHYVALPRRNSGCLAFLFDVFMTFFTCGLWLIWIFIRGRR